VDSNLDERNWNTMSSCSLVEVDYHFMRERVLRNLLEIDFVPTGDQVADGFTKALTVWKLENFKNNLNLALLSLREAVR
jgi:hypothetical protein